MSRLERYIVYPILALLCWAVLGGRSHIGSQSAFAGEPAPTVVTAQRFRLVDADGKERASLAAPSESQQAWGLSFLGADGKDHVFIGLQGDGSSLASLTDNDGVARIVFRVSSQGTAMVILNDKSGKSRLGLDVGSDGVPGMTILDQTGTPRARFCIDGGSPSILSDVDGEVLWRAPSK